jgi:hypothetical protein
VQHLRTILFIVSGVLFSTCNKPSCPTPKPLQNAVPEIKIASCSDTSPPVQITSCVQTLLTTVNRILYARSSPYDGIAHRSCPDPALWKPDEVNCPEKIYHLFTAIDECGSGTNLPHLSHIFVSDAWSNEFEFYLYNAKEDAGFTYYGYCLPLPEYRAHQEFDSGQFFLFYYEDGNGNRISIPKSNIISVKSISLDCDYIKNNIPASPPYYFLHSSFGVSVELEIKNPDKFPEGIQTIKAYVKSVTSSGGEFGGWGSSVFWKAEL